MSLQKRFLLRLLHQRRKLQNNRIPYIVEEGILCVSSSFFALLMDLMRLNERFYLI